MARHYVKPAAIRNAAAGTHPVMTGSHHHGHDAAGHATADDDGMHSHPHGHAGDSGHEHDHQPIGGIFGTPPGAALDDLPCARSWGRFINAVRDPDGDDARQLRRAMDAARPRNAGMSERVPSQGGYLVPEVLRSEILSYMTANVVARRSMRVTMDVPLLPVPVLDNPSQAGTSPGTVQALGGLAFAMVAESAGITPTVPQFGVVELEARKIGGYLQAVPNELFDDSSAFASDFLPRIIASGYGWYLDDLMISQGTGTGEPQALINAPAALSVTRASAGHVVLADILGMVRKLHPASKSRAVWIIADEVFGELLDLYFNFGSATSGITPPAQWLEFDPDADAGAGCWRLLGLPAFPHDHLPAMGSPGDVLLADLNLHLYGDYRELTIERAQRGRGFVTGTSDLRIRARMDSRFWPQSSYVTAANQTVSPLIILT